MSLVNASKQYDPQPFSHGGSRMKKERPKPIGSTLLTDPENEQLFQTMGKDRISLASAIAQLLIAYPDSPNIWRKANVGVAVLVKDYLNRNYALCIYDILNHNPLWSQNLYKNFTAHFYANSPRFITFEGDACMFAMSFANFEEAEKFKEALNRRRDHELRNSLKVQKTTSQQRHVFNTSQLTSLPIQNSFPFQSQNENIQMTGITNIGAVPHFGGNLQHFSISKTRTRESKIGKKKRKERITKEDIGNPTNFMHKVHIGWNATNGFENESHGVPMDETVRNLLTKIGENPDSMDAGEAKFACEFYEKYQNEKRLAANAINQQNPGVYFGQKAAITVNQQTSKQAVPKVYPPPLPPALKLQPQQQPPPRPPPINPMLCVPTLANILHQMPPEFETSNIIGPPPPQRVPGASLATNTLTISSRQQKYSTHIPLAPPPPPPLSNNKPPPPPILPNVNQQKEKNGNQTSVDTTISVPPPPPPPPPPAQIKPAITVEGGTTTNNISKPPIVDLNRTDLLQQIQQGTKLRKIGFPNADRTPIATNPPTTRDNMMAQIKQGTSLKHVDQTEIENNRRSGGLEDLGGIAGALARALEERRRNIIHSDDSSDSTNETNNDSEWEDSAQ